MATARERQVEEYLAAVAEDYARMRADVERQRVAEATCTRRGHRWQDIGDEYRECERCGATTEPRDDIYSNP